MEELDRTRLYATNGKFLVRSIFWEGNSTEERKKYPPLYTLKQAPMYDNKQQKDLPSAYCIYMESVDEYDAAIKLVGNMKNWGLLSTSPWFLEGGGANTYMHEGLKVWREHMRMRDASAAKKALQVKMKDGDTTAAKAVLAETKVKAPVGRKGKTTEKKNISSVSRIDNWKKNQVKG